MRAIVADEWSVLRGGVSVVLKGCDVDVVQQASTATAALSALADGSLDLLILGLVTDQSVVRAVARARADDPSLRLIVLLPEADRDTVLGVLDAGADAVLLRQASEDELHDAVDRVNRGQRFVAPGLLAMLFGEARTVAAQQTEQLLTERERRVLSLLVEGCSNGEIAKQLFIAEATVKTHLHNLYKKLAVTNRVQAVGRAIELRLVY